MDSKPPKGSSAAGTKLRTLDLRPRQGEALKPSELIQINGHAALTLNARRAITVLWHHAHMQGIEENRDYTIEIDELKSDGHKGYEMVVEAVEMLMRTILVVRMENGNLTRVQFLGGNDMSDPDRAAGVLTYSFDKRLIGLLRNSNIWGKIALPVLMAFNSKYAISLYENVAQVVNLEHVTHCDYTLEEFRDMLGVQAKRYAAFGELNRHVIKLAVDEINALAHFDLTILPIKQGKKVTDIRVAWHLKSESALRAAWQEGKQGRTGRRARIAGRGDAVLAPERSIGRGLRTDRKRVGSPKTS